MANKNKDLRFDFDADGEYTAADARAYIRGSKNGTLTDEQKRNIYSAFGRDTLSDEDASTLIGAAGRLRDIPTYDAGGSSGGGSASGTGSAGNANIGIDADPTVAAARAALENIKKEQSSVQSPTFGSLDDDESVKNAKTALDNSLKSKPEQREYGKLEDDESYKNAQGAYDETKNNKPGRYTSEFDAQINALVDKIINREKFDYDYKSDDKYAAAEKSVRDAASAAAENSMAQAARMSGGYGNSYASQAAAQAYAEQMSKATDAIPEYEQLAYNRYMQDYQTDVNNLGILENRENSAYNRYRDTVSDWYNELNLSRTELQDALSRYYNERSFDYQRDRDAVTDWTNQVQLDRQAYADALSRAQYDRNFDYQQYLDELSRGDTEYNRAYNELLAAREDYNNQRQWDYALRRDALSDDRYDAEYAQTLRQYQDSLAQQQWENELKQRQYEDALAQQKTENENTLRQYADALAQQEWENKMAERQQDLDEWYKKQALSKNSGSSSSSSGSKRSSGSSSAASGASAAATSASGGEEKTYKTSQGKLNARQIYNAAVEFYNEHPNVYIDSATVDAWKSRNDHGLSSPIDGEAGQLFKAYLEQLGMKRSAREK